MYGNETSRMLVDFLGADEGCAVTTNATKTARERVLGTVASDLPPALRPLLVSGA